MPQEEAVKEAFTGKQLTFERIESLSSETVVGIAMQLESTEQTGHKTSTESKDSATPGERDLSDVAGIDQASPSLKSRIPWKRLHGTLIVFLHFAMTGVILSFILAGNDVYEVNLLCADSEKHIRP